MGRRKAREGLVSLVYQSQFSDPLEVEDIDLFIDNFEYNESEAKYIRSGYDIISNNLDIIDEKIAENLKNWSFERLYMIDKSILRVSVYELMFLKEIPKEVIANEAVEIAKKYGTKDSSKLINGILGTIIRSDKLA